MSDQEVSDAVYMIAWLADCCDDGGIRGVDVLEQHEREEMAVAIRTVTKALAASEARREELENALKPFAWIGAWLFARPLPDDTVMVELTGLHKPIGLTRGMFKSAHLALNPQQEGSPDHG